MWPGAPMGRTPAGRCDIGNSGLLCCEPVVDLDVLRLERVAGAAGLLKDERSEVIGGVAGPDGLRDEHVGGGGQRHWHAEFPARGEAELEVLAEQGGSERRVKVEVDQRGRLVPGELRAEHRVVEECQERGAVHAAALGQHGDLAQRLDDDAEEDVVRDLDQAGGLALAAVRDAAAERRQQRRDGVERILRAGDGDGELARRDDLGVAADGAARNSAPAPAATARMAAEACGETVEESTMISGARGPVSSPPSPVRTASRSPSAATMMKTTSRSARSTGRSTIFAPLTASGSALALVRLYTATSLPARSRRSASW